VNPELRWFWFRIFIKIEFFGGTTKLLLNNEKGRKCIYSQANLDNCDIEENFFVFLPKYYKKTTSCSPTHFLLQCKGNLKAINFRVALKSALKMGIKIVKNRAVTVKNGEKLNLCLYLS